MIRLLQMMSRKAGPAVAGRGHAYARSGAVKVLDCQDGFVFAVVDGSMAYDVFLYGEGLEVRVTCTCPYFAEGHDVCKHLIAVAIVVEGEGVFASLPGGTRIERVPVDLSEGRQGTAESYDDEDDEDDYEIDEDDEDDEDDYEIDEDDEDDDGEFDDAEFQKYVVAAVHNDARRAARRGDDVGRSASPIGRSSRASASDHYRELLSREFGGPIDPDRSDIASVSFAANSAQAADPVDWRTVVRQATERRAQDTRANPSKTRRLQFLVGTCREGRRLTISVEPGKRLGDVLQIERRSAVVYDESHWDSLDKQVVDACRRAMVIGTHRYRYGYGYVSLGYGSAQQLPDREARVLIPLIAQSGRAWWCGGGAPTPISAAPRSARTRLRLDGARGEGSAEVDPDSLVHGDLLLDDQWVDVLAVDALTEEGFAIHRSRLHSLADPTGTPVLLAMRSGGVRVPAAEASEFLGRLMEVGAVTDFTAAEGVLPTSERLLPKPALVVRSRTSQQLDGALAADYEGTRVLLSDPRDRVYRPEAKSVLQRDRSAEDAACAEIAAYLPEATEKNGSLRFPARDLPAIVRRLGAVGVTVFADDKVIRSSESIDLEVVSGADWFSVRGGAKFGPGIEIPFPELLRAVKDQRSLVTLSDGSTGLLPEEWLAKHGVLLQLGKPEGDGLRFENIQAIWVDALVHAEGVTGTTDASFDRTCAALKQAEGPKPRKEPKSFRGALRPYQRAGSGWLQYLRTIGMGGCLADDMGLGKTVQVLAHLLATRKERTSPCLVVVPKSIVFNWQEEAHKFAPQLNVVTYVGTGRAEAVAELSSVDLVITTYGLMRLDIDVLSKIPFDTVILDEAQAIKNSTTATARAARTLQADHRVAMSGTPVENHVGELASLLEFLNPGLLGGSQRLLKKGAAPQALEWFAKALRPLILRRTKGEVASDLPARTEQTIVCELEPSQRRHYNELRDWYRKNLLEKANRGGLAKMKIQVLEALLRLRQAACHPGLIDKAKQGASSAKLDALFPRLSEIIAEGGKALVFSQFTSFLAIVKQRLDEENIRYEYLDGTTRKREERVRSFQEDPDIPLFLISLKAGGVGLNLTAAQYVFILDPWWNPAVEAQAIDRTHRIGQTEVVFAYRLIAKDTVEEKIAAMQQDKRAIADAILTQDNAILRELTADDLRELLS